MKRFIFVLIVLASVCDTVCFVYDAIFGHGQQAQAAWLPFAILGAALIMGGASYFGGRQNAEEASKAQDEDRKLAREQFDWGQKMDVFDMTNTSIEQARAQKQDTLGTSAALQNRAKEAMMARAIANTNASAGRPASPLAVNPTQGGN